MKLGLKAFFFFFFSMVLNCNLWSQTPSINSRSAPTVVIDPGHGGHDRGARQEKPFCEEKRIALQTAKQLRKYLDQLGYRVVMTRESDIFVPLARRIEMAKQAGSQLFISLHFNSARNPTAQGIEIFFYEDSSQKVRTQSSRRVADLILRKILQRTSASSRGIKKGNFFVLREASMPAILIEGGFISNPNERSQLRTSEYQDKIARGIADGVDLFFRKKRPKNDEGSSLAGIEPATCRLGGDCSIH